MEYCTQNCIGIHGDFNTQKICQFAQTYCNQDTVQFIQLYYCTFKNSFMVLITLGLTVVLLLFEALSYISNFYLAPCVDNLMKSFSFSQTLAGVTFLAFANGAPDVLTAIIAGNSSSQQTAMIPFGSLFGATIFSCGIILARVIKFSPNVHDNGLKVHRGQTIKPILFYLFAACYLVVLSGFYQKMTWYLASVYLILYIIYGGMVIVDEHKKRKFQRQQKMLQGNNNSEFENQHDHTVNFNSSSNDSMDHKQSLLRKYSEPMQPLKLRPLVEEQQMDEQQQQKQDQVTRIVRWYRVFLKYLFMMTVPSYDVKEYSFPKFAIQMTLSSAFIMFSQGYLLKTINGFPIWVIVQGSIIVILAVVYLILRNKSPKITWPLELYSFLVCIIWISTLVAVLINIFELVQVVTGINSVFIGMTFLACGNSVGDYFSIVAFAKKGKGMTAIAGIYSGQLFNLLIGLGISYVVKGINKGTFTFDLFPRDTVLTDVFDNAIVWTVIFSCIILLVTSLVYLRKNKWIFFIKYADFLLIFYIGFIALVSLFAILSDVFGQISCNPLQFIRSML